ncbi:MAG TPA: hypothetical protein GXX69_03160 [Firmicutes bacterium]|jgi:hypothetical protein|nr:hypothetical protein [Bacillota bacterium]
MNRVVCILSILLSLSLVLTGCTSPATEENDLAKPLSLAEIVRALEENGLKLSPVRDESAPELSNFKPAVYQIEDSDSRLLIYLFTTIEQRREAEKEYDPRTITAHFHETYKALFSPFSAKNAVIAYYIPEVGERELGSIPMPGIETVRATVFALNNGQEIVYAGESDSWEAQVVVRYHHYFFKNEKGVLYNDLNGTREVLVRYKLDPKQVETVDFSMTRPHGGSKGSGLTLSSDGTIGDIGSINHVPDKNDVYTLTLQWNGNEETINLQAK